MATYDISGGANGYPWKGQGACFCLERKVVFPNNVAQGDQFILFNVPKGATIFKYELIVERPDEGASSCTVSLKKDGTSLSTVDATGKNTKVMTPAMLEVITSDVEISMGVDALTVTDPNKDRAIVTARVFIIGMAYSDEAKDNTINVVALT